MEHQYTSTVRVREQDTIRWLALGTVIAPVLFILGAFALAPLHPSYSVVSQPTSALAIGPNGGFMRADFLIYGLLVTVGGIAIIQGMHELGAIARGICTVLLALSPLGILWAGIFTMDPETLGLHTLGAMVALGTPVITLPLAGLVLRRAPSWRTLGTWMLVGGPLTLALLIGFSNSVPPSQMATGGGLYGLWQRALGIEVMFWYVALGWLAFRRSR